MKPAIAIALLFTSACFGQKPEFEVATIKPSPPPQMGRIMVGTRGGPGSDDPGRFSCTFCNLKMLLATAYDIREFQISGPSTLDSERFEILAKVPAGTDREQFRLMLQNLLVERFQIKLHHETKEMQTYQLVVAKGGPKLAESGPPSADAAPAGPPAPLRTDKDGFPVIPRGRGGVMAMTPGHARMQGSEETMETLARRLSNMVGRPVTDATGLTGKYDYQLSFAPPEGRGMMAGGPMPPPPPGGAGPGGAGPVGAGPGGDAPPQDNAPTIFVALQEQLGLKLEPKKAQADTIVIDHVEKAPTEN